MLQKSEWCQRDSGSLMNPTETSHQQVLQPSAASHQGGWGTSTSKTAQARAVLALSQPKVDVDKLLRGDAGRHFPRSINWWFPRQATFTLHQRFKTTSKISWEAHQGERRANDREELGFFLSYLLKPLPVSYTSVKTFLIIHDKQ